MNDQEHILKAKVVWAQENCFREFVWDQKKHGLTSLKRKKNRPALQLTGQSIQRTCKGSVAKG